MTRIFASVSFGLVWLLGLWWFSGPLAWMPLFILAVCGAVMGILFYLGLGAWLAWIERSDHDAHEGESRSG
jgi:hypothetical protein